MAVSEKADMILNNGKIITLNPRDETAEAVAIAGDKIIRVGSNADIAKSVRNRTWVIDLKGRTATPGLVESHCHPSMAGLMMRFEVDVRSAASVEDIPRDGIWIRRVGIIPYFWEERTGI